MARLLAILAFLLFGAAAHAAAPLYGPIQAQSMPQCAATGNALQWDSFLGMSCTTFHGGLIGVQTFCSVGCGSTGGTYTPDPGTNSVIVEAQGPGAGSGGCAAAAASQVCMSGSGSAGTWGKALITSGFSGAVVTSPAGGAPGAAGNNAAPNAGTASFGSLVSCPGGLGGAGNGPSAPSTFTLDTLWAFSPVACTFTGSNVVPIATIRGSFSGIGYAWGIGNLMQASGVGGTSALGLGAQSAIQSGTSTGGFNGTGYGSGASGAVVTPGGAAVAGANGNQGIVIVYEFN